MLASINPRLQFRAKCIFLSYKEGERKMGYRDSKNYRQIVVTVRLKIIMQESSKSCKYSLENMS